MWRIDDPQGDEAAKVKYDIVPYTMGKVLDIGCGPFKAYAHFIGVDNGHHVRAFGWQFQPDLVLQAEDLNIIGKESVDSVFSSHTLEHLVDPEIALKEWWRVIKKDGYLVLYLPDKTLYPKCGETGANPDHKSDFDRDDLIRIMQRIGTWDLVVNELRNYDEGPGSVKNEYSFLQVYRKGGSRCSFSCNDPVPARRALVIRYGGYGDMIQTSSIFPGLKKEGYDIVVNTTPQAAKILASDPHVSSFILQDRDQVPNHELGPFWKAIGRGFQKVVNLSGSVEDSLLTMPGRAPSFWPTAARHLYMNHNYMDMTHAIAGVPGPPHPRFYSTAEENTWARRERDRIGGDLIIVYPLNGSSVHKSWPYIDALFARLLSSFPRCRIILLGDQLSQILAQPWTKEPRMQIHCGDWSIRQSLTFTNACADIVIGPETGVLNAAGYEPMPKIVFLSHSSRENLTRDWLNTVSLEPPPSVHCYPCHTLHYGFDNCWRDLDPECPECKTATCAKHTSLAMCQARIPVDIVWAALLGQLKKSGKLHEVESPLQIQIAAAH